MPARDIIPPALRGKYREEAARLKLTRKQAAEKWGIGEHQAGTIMRGLPISRNAQSLANLEKRGKRILTEDDVEHIIGMRRIGTRWAEIAETLGVSVTTAKKRVCEVMGAPMDREPNLSDRPAFIRVRFDASGTLTVSCGEGEDYARSMVNAMTAGRPVASVEIVR